MTPEGKLKKACRDIAKRHKMLFVNVEGKQYNGWPDTECGKWPLGSGIIHIEFKRPGVVLDMTDDNDQQVKRIREIRAAGGEADWCNSVERWRQLVGLDADPLAGL